MLIPTVFHRIWLGSRPLPHKFRAFGDTWRRHHPDWTVKLWTDSHLDRLDLPVFFYQARNDTERADILRYVLLYRYGGVYIDTDFECRRPIGRLLEGLSAFAAYQMPENVAIGILGCTPNHPALQAAVERLPSRVAELTFPESTGPPFFTELVTKFPEVRLFEPSLFYPYLWTEMHRQDEEFPDAYAVHHWSGGWQPEDKLRMDLQVLQGRLAKTEARRQKAQRLFDRAEERTKHATARLARNEKRLASVLDSRWWRLGRLLSSSRRDSRNDGPT